MRGLTWSAAFSLVLIVAAEAGAGWEIEQTSYSLRSSGKEIGRSSSTTFVSKERVRVNDEMTTTILDYDKDKITLLLPAKKMYWTGTIDEYIEAVRVADPKRRVRPGDMDSIPKPDIAVRETPITAEIAGKHSKKYVIDVDGRPFQEIWTAEPFGLAKDLEPKRYMAVQRKMAQTVRSSYGVALKYLGDDALYQNISYEEFPVRTHTYLGDAIIGTEVVRVAQTDVPDSDFAIPEGFSRVSLSALLEAQQVMVDAKVAALRAAIKKAPTAAKSKGKAPTPAPKKGAGKKK